MDKIMEAWRNLPETDKTPDGAILLSLKIISESAGLQKVNDGDGTVLYALPTNVTGLGVPEGGGLEHRYRSVEGESEIEWELRKRWGNIIVRLSGKNRSQMVEGAAEEKFNLEYLSKLSTAEELPKRVWTKTVCLRGSLQTLLSDLSSPVPPIHKALALEDIQVRIARYLPSKAIVRLECASTLLRSKMEMNGKLWSLLLRRDYPEQATELLQKAEEEGLSPRTAFSRKANKSHQDRLKAAANRVQIVNVNMGGPRQPLHGNIPPFHPFHDIHPPNPDFPFQPGPNPDFPHPFQPPIDPRPMNPMFPNPFPNLVDPNNPFARPRNPGHMGPEIFDPFNSRPRGGPRFNPHGGPFGGGGGFGGFI